MSIRERILTLMIGDGCPLLGVNPTSLLHRGSDANDPGCVKTRLRIPKLLSTNSD